MFLLVGPKKLSIPTQLAFEVPLQSQENIGANTLLQRKKSPSGMSPGTNHKTIASNVLHYAKCSIHACIEFYSMHVRIGLKFLKAWDRLSLKKLRPPFIDKSDIYIYIYKKEN